MMKLGWIVIGCGSLALFACQPERVEGPPTLNGHEVLVASAIDLKPEVAPYDKASLILMGQTYPVRMVRTDKKGNLTFDFILHGEKANSERYTYGPGSFSYVGSLGEDYEPPIPLVNSPMQSEPGKAR
jgi:hypothetical protein